MAYMNAANNLILRASVQARQDDLSGDDFDFDFGGGGGFRDPAKFGIAVVNHPMNYTKQQLDTEVMWESKSS